MNHLAVLLQLLRAPRLLSKFLKNRITRRYPYNHKMVHKRKLQLVVLITTRRCNLSCEMCMQDRQAHKKPDKNRVEMGDYSKILEDIRPWNPAIQLTGGEPLLYKEIVPLLENIKKRNLFCIINTNGTMLRQYAVDIVRLGIEKVSVSIEGGPGTHNRICHSSNAYESAISGIRTLAEEKKKQNRIYPFIDVKSVITPANTGELEPVVQLYDTGWIQLVGFLHMWFVHDRQVDAHKKLDTGIDYYKPPDIKLFKGDELKDALKHVRQLQKKYNKYPFLVFPEIPDDQMAYYYSDPVKILHRKKCVYPYETVRIFPGGDVAPCPEGMGAKAILGNILDKSIIDIARGEKARAFLKRLDESAGVWPICTRCCGFFRS
jgi:MoaA/NifB/PqqE/SkfB family radical SAM enzyme